MGQKFNGPKFNGPKFLRCRKGKKPANLYFFWKIFINICFCSVFLIKNRGFAALKNLTAGLAFLSKN